MITCYYNELGDILKYDNLFKFLGDVEKDFDSQEKN